MKPVVFVALAVLAVGPSDTPALFDRGAIPAIPITAVGGGEVLLEVSVDKAGAVTGVKPLRETASFTELMTAAVKGWHFTPAEREIPAALQTRGGPTTEKIESSVLVAGVFRRPTLIGPTLGEPIKDTGKASTEIPYPTSLVAPPHPIGAINPGVVLVEVKVDAKGSVSDAKIRLPSPGYDSVALSTARQWTFRPAGPRGATTPAVVYVVFGFPVPRT